MPPENMIKVLYSNTSMFKVSYSNTGILVFFIFSATMTTWNYKPIHIKVLYSNTHIHLAPLVMGSQMLY